jgi:spore coat polysaccharide biosynthesis predicted glycosyltransferase SpsG
MSLDTGESTALVAVLADAAPSAGWGHLSRAAGLVTALKIRNVRVAAHAFEAPTLVERDGIGFEPVTSLGSLPGNPSAIVLDSYRISVPAARAAHPMARIVAMTDVAATRGADLVVSVAPIERVEQNGLVGTEYACLRPAFWNLPEPRRRVRVETVLVAPGSAPDVDGVSIAEALTAAVPGVRVSVVATAPVRTESNLHVMVNPPDLVAPLARADLVITAAGQTMLEAAASGTPTVAVVTAENQRRQAEVMLGLGAVRLVDSGAEAVQEAKALVAAPSSLSELSRRGREAVDGLGALRVAERISALVIRP